MGAARPFARPKNMFARCVFVSEQVDGPDSNGGIYSIVTIKYGLLLINSVYGKSDVKEELLYQLYHK